MLIKALCNYYDILAANGHILPDAYSKENIHYKIALTEDGQIDEILNCQKEEPSVRGKTRRIPVEMKMPRRINFPGVKANIIDHRPFYLFGLNMEEGSLTTSSKNDKAAKSHKVFVETNLTFTENISSPVVVAFRNFLLSWKPEDQVENKHLLGIKGDLLKSNFVFCLSGSPDYLLHEDPEVKKKWETIYAEKQMTTECTTQIAQCAVTGETEPIARLHDKIKNVRGALSSGAVLIGFNNAAETSYGNIQSYNSNISEAAMKKYTEALNFLLASDKHTAVLDDMTIVFWAMSSKDTQEDLFIKLFLGQQDQMDTEKTDTMLKELLKDACDANVTEERLRSLDMIDPNVDFYMLGLKPNFSRLSVKFIIRRKYADVLWNIARFQKDLQVTEEFRSVALWQIKREMISPKSKNDKVNPAIIAKLVDAVFNGGAYPDSLLEVIVRRVKADEKDKKLNKVRAGIIKACINSKTKKEELKVSLDKTNQTPAYLCGRLFAVLEKLQQDAANAKLNRTIKDVYFASASAKPALVFPKLIRLAQSHLTKLKSPVYYNKLIGELIDGLNGEFPETFRLRDQGRFIVGYYQQNRDLWKKSPKSEETEEE